MRMSGQRRFDSLMSSAQDQGNLKGQGKCQLSQGQPFAACVGSMLVAWISSAWATTIQIPFLVLFLEYAVLDGKATLCFFHYIRCCPLCGVPINGMVGTSALSVGVARDARRRDVLGTKEYL